MISNFRSPQLASPHPIHKHENSGGTVFELKHTDRSVLYFR